MNILLCGDSWMNSAYEIANILEPTHPGLLAYLVEDGHSVINLAVQGGSNELQINKIKLLLNTVSWAPDVLIFMQCPLYRRYRDYTQENYRRWTFDPFVTKGIANKDFDFDSADISDTFKPIVDKLASEIKSFKLPTIIASGNTKMHPAWKDHFEHVLPSGDSFWATHCDSYFSDQESVDNFISVFMNHSNLPPENKKQLAIDIMVKFNTKYDAWRENNNWVIHEHGTNKWHVELYKQVKSILCTMKLN